ncbi:hypothetical protein DPMN_161271 [Dreissena polymorpha]|uniref:Uncharacterized protein n=1 Tax=Dreissena polymorpha TaxID=45954 RepID=A0A9D4ISG2_DREPO|nr:hypothetical protein DPMN_048538 [Dreissena polymorpha]KAH3783334.1 hypothetical protein DPMN_161271 [Dreissena polymorpha]
MSTMFAVSAAYCSMSCTVRFRLQYIELSSTSASFRNLLVTRGESLSGFCFW